MNSNIYSEFKYQLDPIIFKKSNNKNHQNDQHYKTNQNDQNNQNNQHCPDDQTDQNYLSILILNKGVIIDFGNNDQRIIQTKIINNFSAFQQHFFKKYEHDDYVAISYKTTLSSCMRFCQPHYNFLVIITRFNKIYSKKSINDDCNSNYKLELFAVHKTGIYVETYSLINTYYSII
jgi:hypothetical protein